MANQPAESPAEIAERLLPCPFCGCDADFLRAAEQVDPEDDIWNNPEMRELWTVECNNICRVYESDKQKAIAAWNQRDATALQAEREAHQATAKQFVDMQAYAGCLEKKLQAERERALELEEVLRLCDGEGKRAQAFNGRHLPEDAPVLALCEQFGFGAVMDAAARQWFARDNMGAFTVGPCAATVRRALAQKGGNK